MTNRKTIIARGIVAADVFNNPGRAYNAVHVAILQQAYKGQELIIKTDDGAIALRTNALAFLGVIDDLREKVNKKAGELYHDE